MNINQPTTDNQTTENNKNQSIKEANNQIS